MKNKKDLEYFVRMNSYPIDSHYPSNGLSDNEIANLQLKAETLDKVIHFYYSQKEEIYNNSFVEGLGYILKEHEGR